jgi:TatD DNase family protein
LRLSNVSENTCHSGYIPLIAKKIAELKGVTLAEVFQQVRENTKEMYGI